MKSLARKSIKTSIISIPTAAFGVNNYFIKSTSTNQIFYAPVYLPDKAKITKIGFIGHKQSWSKSDTTLTFRYIDSWKIPNNHVVNDIGVVNTATSPTAMQDYYSININNYTINNSRQAYFLILNLPADAPGYPNSNDFYSADITYIIP